MLRNLGYEVVFGPDISEGGFAEERKYGEVVLVGRLRNALRRINKSIHDGAFDEAVKKVLRTESQDQVVNNQLFHKLVTNGVNVEYKRADGSIKISKKIAQYQQYNAVQKALTSTVAATKNDKRAGVVWHTQGSGKSLTMVFYAGKMVLEPVLENPTVIMLTDRNDLDDQLFGTFSRCHDLLRQDPAQANSRDELQNLLKVSSGGIIFTTIQKFFPEDESTEYPILSERKNIIIVADEAHRSQYGFGLKVPKNLDKEALKYGYAKYLRDALPNATFIGFTGTPIEKADRNTRKVFGSYIDVYDIEQAVEDGSTVKIYYENRLAKLELKPEARPFLDRVR